MSDPRARVTVILSIAMVLIGTLLIIRTLAAGGGGLALGVLLGALFLLAGVVRLSVARGSR